jgi:hypothetical protein
MCLAVVWIASGCVDGQPPEGHVPSSGADTVPADIALATAARNTEREPGALQTVKSASVDHWLGPGDRPFEVAIRTSEQEAGHPRRFGSITLQTALRARSVSQYPCTSCHFGRTVVMTDERIDDAHQNIQPVHPEQTGAVCSTCHSADNVEQLALAQGEHATLNQSYRLCAQCHFQQVETWAGGAHGKRLDGWQGRRVLMGCGDCHDPHKPAVEARVPFQAPQLERPRGDWP